MAEHVAPICEKCGERHERWTGTQFMPTCTAHNSKHGTACRRYPNKDMRVCAFHGGNAPQTKAMAEAVKEREMFAQRAAAILADVSPQPIHSDPLKGLLWEVAMSANAVEWYAARLSELGVPVPNGIDAAPDFEHVDRFNRPIRDQQDPENIWGYNHDGDQAPHILLVLWTEERDRHARLCERAIRAGVIERMGALADAHATTIAGVITYVVEALGLPSETREQAKQLAAGRLRSIAPPPIAVTSRPTGRN